MGQYQVLISVPFVSADDATAQTDAIDLAAQIPNSKLQLLGCTDVPHRIVRHDATFQNLIRTLADIWRERVDG